MKGDKAKQIQHYERLLSICHKQSRQYPDPEVRQAFNIFADAYGYLIRSIQGNL